MPSTAKGAVPVRMLEQQTNKEEVSIPGRPPSVRPSSVSSARCVVPTAPPFIENESSAVNGIGGEEEEERRRSVRAFSGRDGGGGGKAIPFVWETEGRRRRRRRVNCPFSCCCRFLLPPPPFSAAAAEVHCSD